MKWDLNAAHKFSSHNREMLEKDSRCGCFYCKRVYEPKEILQWIDNWGATARCAYCGIDSVIPESAGYPLNDEFLSAMYDKWFGTVYKK